MRDGNNVFSAYLLVFFVHSKNCLVKYNLALGKIWMNPAIGLFRASSWVTAQKVGLNI